MPKIHGRVTVVKVATKDLSTFTKQSELTREADEHDVTGGGAVGHEVQGGLTSGKFTMSGTYDSTATTGPRAVLEPLIGTNTAVIRQIEGTGTGLPQDSFTALLKSYVETSPVADMITWSAEFTVSGAVDSTPQA